MTTPAAPLLITGVAGFIGFHVARRCLALGHRVLGFDNVNPYYDPALKEARIAQLATHPGFALLRADLCDAEAVRGAVATPDIDTVIHLGAQPGVRYSREQPRTYIDSNIVGFFNVLEACRARAGTLRHLVFASTSSVYGANTRMPLSTSDHTDHPLSLYAATKKANEAMAHAYSHLYGIPTTGLRFFTVYGPWGRPDMAPMKFTRAILAGQSIDVYNHGHHQRDFTFVDDVAEAIHRVAGQPATPNPDWRGDAPDPASSRAPYRIYNVGNGQPVQLLDFIQILERALGCRAQLNLRPLEPGDVADTLADSEPLAQAVGFRPQTPIERGVAQFVAWYRDYYRS